MFDLERAMAAVADARGRAEERARAARWTGLRWHADLAGEDGNAWVILGVTSKAIRQKHGRAEADEYYRRATSGDYENLIRVTLEYIEIEDKRTGYLEEIE